MIDLHSILEKTLSQDVVMRPEESTDISIPKAELNRAFPPNFFSNCVTFFIDKCLINKGDLLDWIDLMSDKEKILREMRKRQITHFAHFTDVDNIPSILEYGLLTRASLDWDEMEYSYNDEERIDGVEDSVSFSISFPNYRMFYPMTLKYPDRDWCVLLINARKAMKYDCAFHQTNAASNRCRFIPLEDRMTYSAFLSMFQDPMNGISRAEMELNSWETTDPQAEVLVLDDLPVSCIDFCVFKNPIVYSQYAGLFENTDIETGYDYTYFNGRHDYEFWR